MRVFDDNGERVVPSEANARLICSAPTMLSLLERLLAEANLSNGDQAEIAILLAGIEHG